MGKQLLSVFQLRLYCNLPGQESVLQVSVCVASPSHSRPPKAGGTQARPRVLFPPPQGSLQVFHPPQSPHFPSTGCGGGGVGHVSVLQVSVCVASPWHSSPPNIGGVHARDLVLFPPPQGSLQLFHPPQSPHCPSTGAGVSVGRVIGGSIGGVGGLR